MSIYNKKDVDFAILKGKTLVSAEANKNKDEIIFVDSDGVKYIMMHEQDCCERVYIEDICGDFSDLVGAPIMVANESSSEEDTKDEDYTRWTFYNLATIKGHVNIRWLGRSNGYYGVSVDLYQIKD